MEIVEPKLVFTSDPEKLARIITPKLRTCFRLANIVINLTGKEGLIPAGKGEELRRSLGDVRNELTEMVDMIAARHPDMMVSAAALTILSGTTQNKRQLEIAAASVAWQSLTDDKPVDALRLVGELLVKGYPSQDYYAELDAFYMQHPELLWPVARETVN